MSESYTIIRRVGAFRFHSLRDTAVKPELTCCVLGTTSEHLIFLLHCAAIRWEIFFPSLAHRWFAALSQKHRQPQHTELKSPELDRAPIAISTIGYPDRFKPYFEHHGRRWVALKPPANDATYLMMLFHSARTFSPTLNKAPLQFAQYRRDHDLVYANPALQATIGLGLLTLKTTSPSPTIYTVSSTSFRLHDDEHPPSPSGLASTILKTA